MTKVSKALQKSSKYVYLFGNGKADGDGSMKPLLGGKGANLAEMSRIGLPVPPGFTITTEVCTYYYAHKKTYPKELQGVIKAGIAQIESCSPEGSFMEQLWTGRRMTVDMLVDLGAKKSFGFTLTVLGERGYAWAREQRNRLRGISWPLPKRKSLAVTRS